MTGEMKDKFLLELEGICKMKAIRSNRETSGHEEWMD
jgi:hypothetical protein